MGHDEIEIIMSLEGIAIAEGIQENGRKVILLYREKIDDFGNKFYAIQEESSYLEQQVIRKLLDMIKEKS